MSEDGGDNLPRRDFLKLMGASLAYIALKPIELPENWDRFWGSAEYKQLLYSQITRPRDLGGKEKYGVGLEIGLGFASLYGDERRIGTGSVKNQMQMLRNKLNYGGLKGVDLTLTQNWFLYYGGSDGTDIFRKMVSSQKGKTPIEALDSDEIIGVISTRSPMDQMHRYAVYGADKAYDATSLRFIGIVLVTDAPQPIHWNGRLSKLKYSYCGWNNLSWVADISQNVFKQLPVGKSGNPEKSEGRPGVLLVEEDIIRRANS